MSNETKIVVAPTQAEDFAKTRTFLQAAKASMAQGVAFMVLAGAELERLHKLYGIRPGRPALNSPNAGGINSANAGGSWAEVIKRELGIGEETARRYREMFKAARKRVPLLDADELLDTPMRDMPELKQKQLLAAVQKVTDGQTAQQLMWDWGMAKKPQGSAARGGVRTPKGDAEPKLGPAEAAAELARKQTDDLIALLDEALLDKPFHAATKAQREKLHGLLVDLAAAVKEVSK